MNLIIILAIINLLLLVGLGAFLYKLYVDNKELKENIRNNHKQVSEELKYIKRDFTSINSNIKELTKIEELE